MTLDWSMKGRNIIAIGFAEPRTEECWWCRGAGRENPRGMELCPRCEGTGGWQVDDPRLATLAHNLAVAGALCKAFLQGNHHGWWEGGCRITEDDENPLWYPGCGREAPGWRAK